jgi:hypothetical protein
MAALISAYRKKKELKYLFRPGLIKIHRL